MHLVALLDGDSEEGIGQGNGLRKGGGGGAGVIGLDRRPFYEVVTHFQNVGTVDGAVYNKSNSTIFVFLDCADGWSCWRFDRYVHRSRSADEASGISGTCDEGISAGGK